jgi:VWFA-related protein
MTALLSEYQVQRLGWTLLHFLWQGTAIVVVYAMLRRIPGRSLGAHGRYALACAALLAMTAAPPLTFLLIPDGPGMGSWTISAAAAQRLLSGVVALWLLGVLAFSIRLLGGWRFTARLRSTSHPAPAEWQRTWSHGGESWGAKRPVLLLVSSLVDVPTVIGWLRPAILVPVEFFTGLSVEYITALLAHEVAHIRRHDYLASILQGIAEAVLFYHPAVWWISEQIRAERELCCDDLAVAATGDLLAYARALAELETRQPSHFHAVLAANGGSLVNRIRRLIEPAHAIANNLPGPGAAWAMTLLWLAGVGIAAFHGAQRPTVRLTVAPVRLSTALPVAAGKVRNSWLYDPLLPEPPAQASEIVSDKAQQIREVQLEDPPEPVVSATNIDDVLPFHVMAQGVPEPTPLAARPTFHAAPTFRTTTRLVQVTVIARRKGAPATGLTRDDFTLLDNGKPQKIALFSVSSSQTRGPASVPLPAGSVSNRLEELPNATVLLIDQKNTAQIDQAFAILRIARFLGTRRRPDRIGIYTFSIEGSLQVLQEITDDAELLSRAATSLKAQDPHYKDWQPLGRVMDTKHVLEAIARHLASVPGRKSLVWVTTSFPLLPHADPQPDFDARSPMDEAARALTDANVALYAVDSRGLVGALSGMTAISNAEFSGPQSPAQLELQMHAGGGFLSGTDTMSRLADLTGGLVLYNANAIEDSIREALDDSELTYALGFYPTREERDGASFKLHTLKVQVARRGVKLRYRERYFAPGTHSEASGRPTLAELLKDPLDATQLELVTETMPDRARPGFRQVRASIDLHDVHLENHNHNWVGAVDVSFLTEGSQSARTFTRSVEIPEEQLSTALDRGIVVDDSVTLNGVVHVVAQDRATGAAGTVTVPIGSR